MVKAVKYVIGNNWWVIKNINNETKELQAEGLKKKKTTSERMIKVKFVSKFHTS